MPQTTIWALSSTQTTADTSETAAHAPGSPQQRSTAHETPFHAVMRTHSPERIVHSTEQVCQPHRSQRRSKSPHTPPCPPQKTAQPLPSQPEWPPAVTTSQMPTPTPAAATTSKTAARAAVSTQTAGTTSEMANQAIRNVPRRSITQQTELCDYAQMRSGERVVDSAEQPAGGVFQAAAAALVYRQGEVVSRVVSAAGRHAPPEVERFALQLGISAALAKGCQRLVVISDSLPTVESLFSVELRSGQIFSLDCCRAVGPWLAGDPECSVHLWFVPSRMEWGMQKAAHDVVVSLKIAVGRRPRTSRDFLCQCADVEASKDWCGLFKDSSYHGHSFLDLKNSKDKPIQPSTCKGGPWLSDSWVGTSTFSRLCRCITGHAPLGAYHQRFNISGGIHCPCRARHGILETRSHALHSCPRWKHSNPLTSLDTIPTLTKFVQSNAAFCAIVHSRLVWNPG
jgi:hypothetical protein